MPNTIMSTALSDLARWNLFHVSSRSSEMCLVLPCRNPQTLSPSPSLQYCCPPAVCEHLSYILAAGPLPLLMLCNLASRPLHSHLNLPWAQPLSQHPVLKRLQAILCFKSRQPWNLQMTLRLSSLPGSPGAVSGAAAQACLQLKAAWRCHGLTVVSLLRCA